MHWKTFTYLHSYDLLIRRLHHLHTHVHSEAVVLFIVCGLSFVSILFNYVIGSALYMYM